MGTWGNVIYVFVVLATGLWVARSISRPSDEFTGGPRAKVALRNPDGRSDVERDVARLEVKIHTLEAEVSSVRSDLIRVALVAGRGREKPWVVDAPN
jgi:hypothetical protein